MSAGPQIQTRCRAAVCHFKPLCVTGQGPLVVLPRKDAPPLVSPAPDASDVLFLTDFWHFTGNALAMRLNR